MRLGHDDQNPQIPHELLLDVVPPARLQEPCGLLRELTLAQNLGQSHPGPPKARLLGQDHLELELGDSQPLIRQKQHGRAVAVAHRHPAFHGVLVHMRQGSSSSRGVA